MTASSADGKGAGGLSAPIARLAIVAAFVALWQVAPAAGLIDPRLHESRRILHHAIFPRLDQMPDRLVEPRAGLAQPQRQVEHLGEAAVADRQPQIPVIDRQRLLDQVQPL